VSEQPCVICSAPTDGAVFVRVAGSKIVVCETCYGKGLKWVRTAIKRRWPAFFRLAATLARRLPKS
jgi:ribosome-binding protein aMBF1 (putative translation factor)